jgi:Lipocalin-like domain
VKTLAICILLVACCATQSLAREPKHDDTAALERQFIGKWEGARHTDWYLPDHTWFMDFEPGDKSRGTWHIDGKILTKTYSEGGTAVYTIVSISSGELVIADEHGAKYTLKRAQ